MRDFVGRHLLFLQQIKQHAGIDCPAARSHHQTIERGEAHGGVKAPSLMQGAETRAIAKMRHHYSLPGPFRPERGEAACDIFEREPMKAVAADAALLEMPGKGKTACRRPQAVMERRIEAGDLQHVWLQGFHDPDRRQTARLVQGCERRQGFQRRERLIVDYDWTGKIAATLHDAVSHGDKPASCKIVLYPGEYIGEQAIALSLAGGAVLLEQILA